MRRSLAYICAALVVSAATGTVRAQQATGSAPAANATPPAAGASAPPAVLKDYTKGPSVFSIVDPYKPQTIPPLQLENSPRLQDMIRNGRIQLSLSQALASALENNLDIEVQRYVRPIAEADVLRASSGQAARGIPGATMPAGLNAGAIGVGVNAAGGFGGVGAAGGISGGGGAVYVPQSGTFDPAFSISTSYDNVTSPLNSTVVAGVPQVNTGAAASGFSFAQMFPEGSSFQATITGIAQNSTQRSLLFNPAVISRLAVGVNQPLLNGFGFLPNKRFMMVAANNLSTSDELFRQQVTSTVVQVENAYWDLAASREAVAAAQRALDAANQLVTDTNVRVQVGTAAGIDVKSAESAAAAAERDLIVAKTTVQQQEANLKSYISKVDNPALDAATIETTDPLPDPDSRPIPDLQAALKTALDRRPELKTAAQDIENEKISDSFTRNGLLPQVSAFALYATSGLTGDTPIAANGFGESLSQVFGSTYPEYGVGIGGSVPLRNRSAQADNIRARLEAQQYQVQVARTRQQVALETRQAVISLMQGRAQVQAAHEALRLSQETVDAERQKLQLGVSTPYDVILRERDLLSARQADLTAMDTYAKALVDFDRATGTTLEQNGIDLEQAFTGNTAKAPTPSMVHTAASTIQK